METPEWQQRVKDEAQQLSERLQKLRSFLAAPPKELSTWDEEILKKQENVMDQYLRILTSRIQNF